MLVNILDKDKIKYYYGIDNKYIDVTIKMKLITNKVVINNKLIGSDPYPNKEKYLKVVYGDDEFFFKENTTFELKYTYPDNVYDKSKIKNMMSKYNNAVIFGKGPTFKNIEKKNGEFRCTINQASNMVDDVDLICMNDFHNIDLINEDVYKKLKYLLIPEYLHINQRFDKNGYWVNVYNKLKDKFNGIYIIYNLASNPSPNIDFISLPSRFTSANNCVDFICIYTKIKDINLYGIGVNSKKNYNDLFIGNGKYTPDRTQRIKAIVENVCKKHNVKYIFN